MNTQTSEHFACKVLPKEMSKYHSHAVSSEIAIHMELKHDHIVKFISSFDSPEFTYMILTLCKQSLRDLMKKRGIIDVDICRYFVCQILKGVEFIHKRGYIHRDLKSANILLDAKNQIKIADFGLAIHLNNERLKEHNICGTTHYLAPEVVLREGFKLVTDIWAVGVITYEMAFGFTPFDEDNSFDESRIYRRIYYMDYR